ncbi:MAG TPA: alginate lyase family protein [Burkholderiales bacterium]
MASLDLENRHGDVLDRLPTRAGLLWYVNRLRCMSLDEVRHRLRRALELHAERWGLRRPAAAPHPDLAHASRPWIHAAAKVEAAPYLGAADRVAAGRFDLYALRDVELGSPPRWNRDPRTGVDAPLTFGMLLDYRNPRLVGDIKYLWELNRHSHLVTLAQAHALSGNARYGGAIRAHLESWFAACPYPLGPNWSSALEAALRLINWSVAWQLLGGASSPLFEDAAGARFRQQWLDSVFRHAQFVRKHFSLHSSANNHLIGEAAGLFIATLTWPGWPQMRAWRMEAKAILEREAVLQNAPDGVNREQTVAYQLFELELLLLPLLAGRANGTRFTAAYESRMEAMMEFVASIMDAGGNVPMIGDSDDSFAVGLSPGGEPPRYRPLLATAAILFRRGDFKAKAGGLNDHARWLLGDGADAAFEQLGAPGAALPLRRAFPIGGYYVLGCDFETANEIRLVADAGPLGYLSIAAHGHADALAFTLAVGGREILVDPGTYAYHRQSRWRRHFRGTGAHNTVRVDGVDQSQPGGNFVWLRKANAGCSLWRPSAERDVFEGWHDGYLRLPDPVLHRRRITLEKPERRVVIEDSLQMSGTHAIELFFHCSEPCLVDPAPGGYRITREDHALLLTLPQAEGAAVNVHRGSLTPIAGWVSRRFDDRQPAPTIRWSARLAGNAVLRSEIAC